MKKIRSLLFVLLAFAPAFAHIGSPEVVMQGQAGSYVMMVSVTPPDVIPGIAKVVVYTQNEPISKMSATAMFYRSGPKGAAPPETLNPVTGNPGQYSGDIWLMSSGSASIRIMAEGKFGKGELIVPVVAISTAQRSLPPNTGWILAGLGLFLFILMATIMGSSVSDALRKTTDGISPTLHRKRWIGVGVGALLTALALYGGNAWWQSWADDYKQYMYKPGQATSTLATAKDTNALIFTIDTNGQRKSALSFAVPDHGKLMHLFLLRYPAMDAFAHLHPQRLDSATFKSILPALPKGKYLVFADIVYLSGFTETIKDTFNLTTDLLGSPNKLDPDDAYAFALPANLVDDINMAKDSNLIVCGKPGTGVKLPDGSTMVWEGMTNDPIKAGEIQDMKFSVLTADKQPAKLDAYLGMGGHAAIMRNDCNVYMHLHPVGTFAMSSVKSLNNRLTDTRVQAQYPENSVAFRDSIDQELRLLNAMPLLEKDNKLMEGLDMAGMYMDSTGRMLHPNMVSFPYSFPSPGQYRIWVQVKYKGKILTGAFDKVIN